MFTFPTLDLFWCTIISIMLSLDVTGMLISREVARVLRVKKSELTTDMYNIIYWDYETNAELLWNSKIDKFIEEGILGC